MQAANRARKWWKDNRGTFMASVETTLNIVEKALNGLPSASISKLREALTPHFISGYGRE
jgi:hypothetical protein